MQPDGSGTEPTAPPLSPAPVSPPKTDTTKNIIVILLVLFLFPVGLILMWFWTSWKTWVKVLVTVIPFILIVPLSILMAIVLVAINPNRQFAQANDTQRRSDVNMVLNGIDQVMVDQNGTLPGLLAKASGNTPLPFTSSNAGAGTALCNALVPQYMAQLPIDPQTGSWTDCTNFNTGYTITVIPSSSGASPKVMVSATGQMSSPISVTR